MATKESCDCCPEGQGTHVYASRLGPMTIGLCDICHGGGHEPAFMIEYRLSFRDLPNYGVPLEVMDLSGLREMEEGKKPFRTCGEKKDEWLRKK